MLARMLLPGLAVAMGAAELAIALLALAGQRWIFPRRTRPRLDPAWLPRCSIVIPTKGAAPQLADNLGCHLQLDYPDYEVIFAVESESDPGVPVIRGLVARSGGRARLVVAGWAAGCSQQNHNMIAGAAAARGAEVLAFCDNDVAPGPHWLRSLILPLSRPGAAVATGYRWLLPSRGTTGEQVHTFMNMTMFAHFSVVNQLLGQGLWGGSFALRQLDFAAWDVAGCWGCTISDDLALAGILRRRRRKSVLSADVFLVTEDTLATTPAAAAWYRRQLLTTKAYEPGTWLAAGIPSVLAGGLVLLLPLAAAAHWAGRSFSAWGGETGLLWWGVELTLVLLYAQLGPTRHLWGMVLRLPVLRLVQAWAFLKTLGQNSLVWSGTRYRFDRSGRVIEITRGVRSAEA